MISMRIFAVCNLQKKEALEFESTLVVSITYKKVSYKQDIIVLMNRNKNKEYTKWESPKI